MIHACSSQSTHMRNTWQNKVTALVEHDCVIQRGRRVAGIRSRPVRHEFVHTLCHAPVVHVSDTRIAAEWPRCVFDECGADVEVCSDVTDGHVVRQALLHHALPHVLRERQRHRRASGAEEQMLESAERTYVRQRVCTRCCTSGCKLLPHGLTVFRNYEGGASQPVPLPVSIRLYRYAPCPDRAQSSALREAASGFSRCTPARETSAAASVPAEALRSLPMPPARASALASRRLTVRRRRSRRRRSR